jgi:UDP-GlcNAc:undecaprenyl-phosphate GlcNAc-1-phosphate transferase
VVRPRHRGALATAVLLASYDLREMAMLGDAGANALGAVLGFGSVERFSRRRRWSAIAALAGLTLLGERRSLGALIESTPPFRELDALGRQGV